MKKLITSVIGNLEELVAGTALALMITVVCVNVFLRYVFNNSQIFLSEFSLLCMSWATFLGMAAAYKRNMHFGMDFLSNHLSQKNRMRLRAFITLVLLVLFAFLAYVAWDFALTTTKYTPVAEIPYTWIDMAPALGFTSMTIYSVIYLIQYFVAPKKYLARYADKDSMIDSEPDIAEMEDNNA